MSEWYNKISSEVDFSNSLLEAISFFEKELEQSRKEINISGSLEQASASLPGIVELRYRQLQEIEAILEFLNIKFKQAKFKAFKHYLEGYNKQLSSKDAERYADADPDVINFAHLINRFALLRNQFLAIHKALDIKAYQISNITKLRTAGLEDIVIKPIYVPKVRDYDFPDFNEDA
jgi:aspartate oxidase